MTIYQIISLAALIWFFLCYYMPLVAAFIHKYSWSANIIGTFLMVAAPINFIVSIVGIK
jgi:hypothetical protein